MNPQTARSNILNKLKSSSSPYSAKQLDAQVNYPPPEYDQPIEQFTRVLTAHHTEWAFIQGWSELPMLVASRVHQSAAETQTLFSESDERLTQLDWHSHQITLKHTTFNTDHQTAISVAKWGIAETGTLVICSSKNNPTSHCFLAEHHIIVLEKRNLLSNSETAWRRIKETFSTLPRAVNFISGPSSSADVGLKLEYGAHGPRSLCVFIIDN